jgi:hypothetical protein
MSIQTGKYTTNIDYRGKIRTRIGGWQYLEEANKDTAGEDDPKILDDGENTAGKRIPDGC